MRIVKARTRRLGMYILAGSWRMWIFCSFEGVEMSKTLTQISKCRKRLVKQIMEMVLEQYFYTCLPCKFSWRVG